MRTYDEILADAKPGSAFSNSSQFEHWAGGPRGCYTCRNDDEQTERYCSILCAAVGGGGIPREWTTETAEDHIHGNYTCTEYDRRPDDGDSGKEPDPDPGPPPAMEGQIDMFEVFAERIADEATAQQVESVTTR
jgi:hypothetical protein